MGSFKEFDDKITQKNILPVGFFYKLRTSLKRTAYPKKTKKDILLKILSIIGTMVVWTVIGAICFGFGIIYLIGMLCILIPLLFLLF